jgi:hypothetical protein
MIKEKSNTFSFLISIKPVVQVLSYMKSHVLNMVTIDTHLEASNPGILELKGILELMLFNLQMRNWVTILL